MKKSDFTIPNMLPVYLTTCKQIVEFGSCTNLSISCKKCPFHDTGLCDDVWGHAKEFIELFKPSITGTMRKSTWEDFERFCEKADPKSVEQNAQQVQKEILCEDDDSKIKSVIHMRASAIQYFQDQMEELQEQLSTTENLLSEAVNEYNETLKLERSEIVLLYEP